MVKYKEKRKVSKIMAYSYKAISDNVKLVGRTYFDGEKLWCGLSGSGISFKFRGTKCDITIGGDNIATSDDEKSKARFAILVNGDRVIDDIVTYNEKTYSVISSESEVACVITLIKLSESAMSALSVNGIEICGEILPADKKDKFIEFIGDSITCGYGVDDEDENHNFSTSTEDVTKAYAYRTAKAMDVDYSMVSYSGYGIISGYTGDGVRNEKELVPPYYENPAFTYGSFGDVKPQDLSWDFTERQPDIIVINLGTNDDSFCLEFEERRIEYCEKYVDFLKVVRKNNPDSKIVCCLGIMTERLCPYVEKTVADYTAATGDNNISTLRFTMQLPEDGLAANYHPTAATHKKAAAKLAAYLKTII